MCIVKALEPNPAGIPATYKYKTKQNSTNQFNERSAWIKQLSVDPLTATVEARLLVSPEKALVV